MSEFVKIVEVGPRDGLQNEKTLLSVEEKVTLIRKLRNSGLSFIEIGAFVSPKWVPQMADTDEVCGQVLQKPSEIKNHTPSSPHLPTYSCLVPNEEGFNRALKAGLKEIAVFGSCTETFCQKNINCSIEESYKRFQVVFKRTREENIRVRAYLSVAFGCPYEKQVSVKKVLQSIERMFELGAYEVSLGDTIAVAKPKQVKQLIKQIPFSLSKIALHFHDTHNLALSNVEASLEEGVRVFDSSVGGLGGCPYAKSASGNLATEKLVSLLHKKSYKTGIHLNQLLEIKEWLKSVKIIK